MNKKQLSERDICTKFITPALRQAGWDEMTQLREEVSFTKGQIIVRGRLVTRGKAKRADYILYYKPNIPLAVIEAKDQQLRRWRRHSAGARIRRDAPDSVRLFVKWHGFVFHDKSVTAGAIEKAAFTALAW